MRASFPLFVFLAGFFAIGLPNDATSGIPARGSFAGAAKIPHSSPMGILPVQAGAGKPATNGTTKANDIAKATPVAKTPAAPFGLQDWLRSPASVVEEFTRLNGKAPEIRRLLYRLPAGGGAPEEVLICPAGEQLTWPILPLDTECLSMLFQDKALVAVRWTSRVLESAKDKSSQGGIALPAVPGGPAPPQNPPPTGQKGDALEEFNNAVQILNTRLGVQSDNAGTAAPFGRSAKMAALAEGKGRQIATWKLPHIQASVALLIDGAADDWKARLALTYLHPQAEQMDALLAPGARDAREHHDPALAVKKRAF